MTQTEPAASHYLSQDRENDPHPAFHIDVRSCAGILVHMMPNPPKPTLEQMAAEQTEAFLRRSSTAFLECAINLMMSHMKREEVVEMLRTEAAYLEEFG